MALTTRSWNDVGTVTRPLPPPARHRSTLAWMLACSLLVAWGLRLVYIEKARQFGAPPLLNLNTASGPADLLPYLEVFPQPGPVAERTYAFLEAHRPLPNVGSLARLRDGGNALLPLARLKSRWIVRTPEEYRHAFLRWTGLYFAGFYFVLLAWSLARFRGDRVLLPPLHLLTGLGLILMVSLRDPLRDTLEFRKFALGVFAGCLLLLLPLFRFFRRRYWENWCYAPLFGAFALFLLLWRFGSGPGGSDIRVNLGPFQPVEAIKILLAFFLAGYFARRWQRLRELRQRWFFGPRFSDFLPVLCAVGIALLFFFTLKDLGPALITFALFAALLALARGRAGMALAGVALLAASVTIGYRMGRPATVVDRVDMWLSPWDNNVRGGDQLAHAIWGFATGGPWGSGPGRGDPQFIPASNTDLVLPSIGEEWGFAGVAAVLCLLGFLVYRVLRIARRAPTEHGVFLAAGLGSLVAFEMLLISAGALGVLPLSGVVSPFLSSGNTAMLANFLVFALLLSLSADSRGAPLAEPFARPLRRLELTLAACGVVLIGAAAYYQVFRDREYLARDTHVIEGDGVKRAQHNPRINSLAREIRRGNIFDRNGVLLATSDWGELEKRRRQYDALGISIDRACSRLDSRHYPFGADTAHLLGDLRTHRDFHATNSSLVERDSDERLRGYTHAELVSLVRQRHQPESPALRAVLRRERDVRTTLDIRLQLKAGEIFRHVGKGALVVIDAPSGDLLAMVSHPEDSIDRARYGLYPPGSTFKLVTAMAALRRDPSLRHRTFSCVRLPDGRAGARIRGWNRPIRDDINDRPHGSPDMERAIQVSCNAYFAQLGVNAVGWQALAETAHLLGVETGDPAPLRLALPFAAYGQGPVLLTPFEMARVAATIANGGRMPEGRWVIGAGNHRTDPPREIVPAEPAGFLAHAMRLVVTSGTARHAMAGESIAVAGKTGTAQLENGQPHSWFAGFAPYGGRHPLAFAVLVEHGGYGASGAAPLARKLLDAAGQLGLVE